MNLREPQLKLADDVSSVSSENSESDQKHDPTKRLSEVEASKAQGVSYGINPTAFNVDGKLKIPNDTVSAIITKAVWLEI